MLICDTSGLLALSDGDDPDHARVAAAFHSATPPYVVSPLIVAEFDQLVRVRAKALRDARSAVHTILTGAFEPTSLSQAELRAAAEVDERYGDLNVGLADASLVVLARRYRTRDILTLDERGFRTMTPLQGGFFRMLPADFELGS